MKETNLLFEILKSELRNEKADLDINSKSADALYSLAEKQDLLYSVCHFLNANGIKTDKSQKGEILEFYRLEQQKFTLKEVKGLLNSAQIPFIPLKGSVIREYYPNEFLRSSCDIDILIKPEDLKKAEKLLLENGYKKNKENFHDISFTSSNNVHIELHFSLLEQEKQIDIILVNAWNYTVLKENSEHKFTDEFFVFYLFAHAFHHFLVGGCGIKTVMDLYVLQRFMKLSSKTAKGLLEEAKLLKFAIGLENLSKCWFSDAEETDQTRALGEYILRGGVYGNKENFVKVYNSRMKNSSGHFLKIMLPKADKIKKRYNVKGILTLLYYPVYWLEGYKRHKLTPAQNNESYNVDSLLKDLGITKNR